MASSSDLVVLTGSTGFIGFRTLRVLLAKGYAVRAVVRSQKKADQVRSNPSLKEANDSNLSFAIIPDLGVDGAYDGVVDGAKYVVHVASPLPYPPGEGETRESVVVAPALTNTLVLLEATRKVSSVKRVVITSSAIATVPLGMLLGSETYEQAFNADYRADEIPSPYFNHVQVAYAAGKILALRRAEEWMAKEKPEFDLIHIHPSFVHGRDDTCQTLEDFSRGTNAPIISLALGQEDPVGKPMGTVHVNDVADAHVLALDPKIPGGQSFMLSAPPKEGEQWNHIKDFVSKHFPDAVEKGILPNNGSLATTGGKLDSSKTEKVLGIKHKSFEDQVVSIVGQYLEVYEKVGGAGAAEKISESVAGFPQA